MSENPQPAAAVKRAPAAPVVRMDRSRDFGTVHGEKLPGDRHAKVFFYQDGLPFNAEGILVVDHLDITEDPAKQAKVQKLLARSAKLLEAARGERDEDDDDEDEEDEEKDDKSPINLEQWARGEQKLQWQLVTNAIAQRFAVRVSDKRSALELLIAERVVSKGQLSREHQRLLAD